MSTLNILTVLFIIISPIQLEPAKLNVEILYESLCPDSLQFITQQLHPVWADLAPYINLILTPFGKSASLENEEFVCQHGPLECKGNRIMSCALNLIADQSAQVEYVNCFMKVFKKGRNNENESGQECAQLIGLDFNEIARCYSSSLGTQLQLSAEKRTQRVAPSFVPTILFNNEFHQQLQDNSLIDFRSVVCEIISQTQPDACKFQTILRL